MEKFQTIETQIVSENSYAILSGSGVFSRENLEKRLSFNDYVIFVDSEVDRFHADEINAIFPEQFEQRIVVPSGESSKSIQMWSGFVDELLARGVTRKTQVFAIGGGVVGDLVGFVAASCLRGIPLVHIPTTLLAMVDSSIGGKTGVNHPQGKNLVGSFYQPKLVVSDTRFLSTLSESEFFSGMGEVIKYALLASREDFLRLLNDFPNPNSDHSLLDFWIEHGIRSKVNIVENDEKEAGIRAYLNLGHTFAHAIEATLGYGTIAHGEAVFWGLMAALFCSERLGAPVDPKLLDKAISYYGKTAIITKDAIETALTFMKKDKKVEEKDVIRLVLLRDYGSPYIKEINDLSLVEEAFEFIIERHSLA